MQKSANQNKPASDIFLDDINYLKYRR